MRSGGKWLAAFGRVAGNTITVLFVSTVALLLVAVIMWAAKLIASMIGV